MNQTQFTLLFFVLLALLGFLHPGQAMVLNDKDALGHIKESLNREIQIRNLNEQQQASISKNSEQTPQKPINISDIQSQNPLQPKLDLIIARQRPTSKDVKPTDINGLIATVMLMQDINGRVIYKNNNHSNISAPSLQKDSNKEFMNSFQYMNTNGTYVKNLVAKDTIQKEQSRCDVMIDVLRVNVEIRGTTRGGQLNTKVVQLSNKVGQLSNNKTKNTTEEKNRDINDIQNDGYPQPDSNRPPTPKPESNVEFIPFCIIVPSYNNAQNNLYIRNINSIIQQEYPFYRVVYIDDNSEDNTTETVVDYLEKVFDVSQSEEKTSIQEAPITENTTTRLFNKYQWTFIKNSQRKYPLENIYSSIHNHCQDNQIAVILDGSDALVGTQTLSYLNRVYKLTKSLFIYSNYAYKKHIPLNKSYTMPTDWPLIYEILKTNDDTIKTYEPIWVKYELQKFEKNLSTYTVDSVISYEKGPVGIDIPANIIKKNKLRETQKLFASHLLTFSVELFKKIHQSHFQDETEQFFKYAYDRALTLTLTETAYPRVHFLKDILYEYSANTETNDSAENWGNDSLKIRSKKPLECLKKEQVDEILQRILKK